MKQCGICDTDMPTSLHEFGDPSQPICQMCWLGFGEIKENACHVIDEKISEIENSLIDTRLQYQILVEEEYEELLDNEVGVLELALIEEMDVFEQEIADLERQKLLVKSGRIPVGL